MKSHTHTHTHIYIYIYIYILLVWPFDDFHIAVHNTFSFRFWSCLSPVDTNRLHLPIVREVFLVFVSGLSDTTRLLHESTCCLWALWRVLPRRAFVFDILRSHPSFYSTPELPCFGCAQSVVFQHGYFYHPLWCNSSLSFLLACV